MTTGGDSRMPRGGRPIRVLAHVLLVVGLASEAMSVAGTIGLGAFYLSNIAVAVFLAMTIVVGWVLAWKRPRVSLGWLLLAIGCFSAVNGGPITGLGFAVLDSAPTLGALLLSIGATSQWAWIPPLGLMLTQVPLRFPTGRLPSSGWRWFSRYTIAALVVCCALAAVSSSIAGPDVPNPVQLVRGDAAAAAIAIAQVLLATAFLGSVASLVVRYRRADAVGRAQLRWFFWAMGIVIGLLVAGWIENAVFGSDDAPGLAGAVAVAGDTVVSLSYSLIPIAILVAVLRSGLYAIDRIISRTAAYAAVTVGVIAVYVGVVLLGSLLLPDSPSVPVATGTLAAAAIFLPLLRVIRRRVDRRFNRSQYDAQAIVDAFGERIRTGADPHEAAVDLAAAVERSLQPTSLGLWTPESAQ